MKRLPGYNLDADFIIEAAMLNKGQTVQRGEDMVPMLFFEDDNGISINAWLAPSQALPVLVADMRAANVSVLAAAMVADAYMLKSDPEHARNYERGSAKAAFAHGDPDAFECLIVTLVRRSGKRELVHVPYSFDLAGNLVFEDRITSDSDDQVQGFVVDQLCELVRP